MSVQGHTQHPSKSLAFPTWTVPWPPSQNLPAKSGCSPRRAGRPDGLCLSPSHQTLGPEPQAVSFL